jgi:hypothetical protein
MCIRHGHEDGGDEQETAEKAVRPSESNANKRRVRPSNSVHHNKPIYYTHCNNAIQYAKSHIAIIQYGLLLYWAIII